MDKIKDVMRIIVCITVTVVSLVAALTAGIATLNLPSYEKSDVASACGQVKAGMTVQQANAAIHDGASFFHETADFTTNEYVYWGRGGTCSVTMGLGGAEVAKVQFDPPPGQNASPAK
jgi:membrane-bound inhibitor of C-type lysozyme